MPASALSSFKQYIQVRSDAETKLKEATEGGRVQGPLLLLGQDLSVLNRLGRVAVETEGAALEKLSTADKERDVRPEAGVIVMCIKGGNEAEMKEKVAALHATTVYVYSSGSDREPWAVDASSHEFEVIPGADAAVYDDFRRFVRVLRCPPAPCLGPGSYFVSLTYSDVSEAMSSGEEWKPPAWAVEGNADAEGNDAGGDAPLHHSLEVRVDLLKSQDEAFVLSQLALVRRRSEGLPIIYTVRSKNQGGDFPDDEQAALLLMMTGIRFGVEYLDLEACWSKEARDAFLTVAKQALPGVRVIGSYHEVQKTLSCVSDDDISSIFHECAHGPPGSIDIVKVVGKADSAQCSIRINQAALRVREAMPPSVESLVAICTTDAGRLSRALNVMLGPTPVAHPSLPGKAAPGQLSAVEIERIRRTLGLDSNPFSKKNAQVQQLPPSPAAMQSKLAIKAEPPSKKQKKSK
jgi:3-dehydroquinate dehydratase type I